MKTQIIRLETHDDFISARDKMGWSQTGRILLVYPKQVHVLNRQLDLTLLQRHSRSLGAQLALVTEDPEVIYQAKKIGIPVFRDVQKAQKTAWRTSRKSRRPRYPASRNIEVKNRLESLRQAVASSKPELLSNPALRLIIFTIGVLALLSIAAVLLPEANITIDPKIEQQELILTIQAHKEVESVNFSGKIPTHTVKVEVEGRSSIPSHGIVRVPDGYARGRILFTNLTDRIIFVPAGTVVRSVTDPPIRFATSTNVQVPAGVGNTTSVSIQAIDPGSSGNVDPETLVAIEGEAGANLTANNPQPTQGGSDRILTIATRADREQLFDQLQNQLQGTALEEMHTQIAPGDILFTPTITLSQVVEQIYEPAPDLPGDTLNLSLRLEFQAEYASQADIERLATYLLDANTPEFYQVIPGTLSIKSLSPPTVDDDGKIQLRILAERQIRAVIPDSQAINLTLGQPPESAVRNLQTNLPLASNPLIQISPRWWPRLPILPFRVVITTSG